jgi:hypothetical protein
VGDKVYSTSYSISRRWEPGQSFVYYGAVTLMITDHVPWYCCWPIQQYGRSDGHVIWNYHWGEAPD